MPGKLCNGKPTDQPLIKNMQAYCEGFRYRLGGTAVERPKANNPYNGTNDTDSAVTWDRGWDICDAYAGQTLTTAETGCCDGAGQTVPGP